MTDKERLEEIKGLWGEVDNHNPLTPFESSFEWLMEMTEKLLIARDLVDEQAECEGLWFQATLSTEEYLQNNLRALHQKIEQ